MILGDNGWLPVSFPPPPYTSCFGLKVPDVYSPQTFVELTFCTWVILTLLNIY